LNQPWPGYTIAPWIVVGLVLLLFLGWMGWLLYEYIVRGTWNMLVPRRDVDVDSGKTAADDDDEEVVAADWQTRWLNRLLDAL
jgi:hypothetical protein